MKININPNELPTPITSPSGEFAWDISGIYKITDYAKKNCWIILGGDVLTKDGKYTYDSWYYKVNTGLSVKQNVDLSIQNCLEYIHQYSERNGNMFYYVPVLTDSYIDIMLGQ